MATVKVYKYETTDAKLGQPVQAKRMGTLEVDGSKVDADGKTEI